MPLVAALARLFPELPKMVGVRILPEVLSPDQEKFRLLDAVATLLERIADDQPILLGIDNLQWADSASLELTMYLTVRLHSSRVALVGATRPPNMPSTQAENSDRVVAVKAAMTATKILGDLMRQGLLMLLPLSPLDMEATVQHIHALLPGVLSASIEQSLLNRAEGNPFFLEELVRMLTIKHQLVLNGNTWHVHEKYWHGTTQQYHAGSRPTAGRIECSVPGDIACCRSLWPNFSIGGVTARAGSRRGWSRWIGSD